MAPLNVLISGAGVAGPSLAFWLNRLGHAVTVVEFFPTLRSGGQQLDCRGQGIQVIRQMGIEGAIREAGVDEDGMVYIDPNGKPSAVFLANVSSFLLLHSNALLTRRRRQTSGKGREAFTTQYEIMRRDLCRVLYDVTKDRTTYRFGTSVTSFEQNPDASSVTVHFSDSTSASYDLLVGADGQNSRLRRQLLGVDAPSSFHSLGLFASYFSVPRTPRPEADKLMRVMQLPNHRGVVTRCDNRSDLMQAYLFMMPPTEEGRERYRKVLKQDVASQKAALVEDFADAGWEVPLILESLKTTTSDFYMQELGQVKTNMWSKGRVVLLGDAAYCPSPLTGIGTTSAFIGAYVLAGELSQSPDDISRALRNYDTTLRPFVKEVQTIPWGLSAFFPKSSTTIQIIQTIMTIVAKLRIDRFFQAILPEDRGGWNLPEYPALRESAPVA
jgi:2-polyprenyl-6-methoxyphenol hydroxylase-like FAD-dependent oxidoreductase